MCSKCSEKQANVNSNSLPRTWIFHYSSELSLSNNTISLLSWHQQGIVCVFVCLILSENADSLKTKLLTFAPFLFGRSALEKTLPGYFQQT